MISIAGKMGTVRVASDSDFSSSSRFDSNVFSDGRGFYCQTLVCADKALLYEYSTLITNSEIGVNMRVFQVFVCVVSISVGGVSGIVRADMLSNFTSGTSSLTFGTEYAGSHTYDLMHHGGIEHRSGVNAGNFNDNLLSNPTVNSNIPVSLLVMYCIDLTHTINLSTTYQAEINLDGYVVNHVDSGAAGSGALTTTSTSGTLLNAGKIGYLMKEEAFDIYTLPINDTKDYQQVGLQAAIWELVYGENFTSTLLRSPTNDLPMSGSSYWYDKYLDLVESGDFQSYVNDVLWINVKDSSGYRQAQVGYLPSFDPPEDIDPPQVPVPTTLTMLFSLVGTGFLGRFGKRYFKRNQVAA
ncbi:MAG: hypothetical protein WD065_18665 [Planctomycetaceae bacterium]